MNLLITPLSYFYFAYLTTPQCLYATTVGATAGEVVSNLTQRTFNNIVGKKASQPLIINIASTVLYFSALYFFQTTFIGWMGGQLIGFVPWSDMLIKATIATIVIKISFFIIESLAILFYALKNIAF